MKQELALESRSAKTCTGGVLLVLTVTWATNTLLTCLEGMEALANSGHRMRGKRNKILVCKKTEGRGGKR